MLTFRNVLHRSVYFVLTLLNYFTGFPNRLTLKIPIEDRNHRKNSLFEALSEIAIRDENNIFIKTFLKVKGSKLHIKTYPYVKQKMIRASDDGKTVYFWITSFKNVRSFEEYFIIDFFNLSWKQASQILNDIIQEYQFTFKYVEEIDSTTPENMYL
jgi:hypothetical protein